ncbi:MAG: hypothetical protein AAFY58_07680, partial [Planctomycetota bacterium]
RRVGLHARLPEPAGPLGIDPPGRTHHREGTNPQQLAKDLKLWGPARDAVMGAARRVDPERARGLWEACVEADAAGKSGLGKHERHAERLAIRFASVMH